MARNKMIQHSRARKLIDLNGGEAFLFIISLRLMPFMPSGIVTFFAAVGRVSTLSFLIASTIGKFPALLLEAFSVYHVIEQNWIGRLILIFMSIIFLLYLWKLIKKI